MKAIILILLLAIFSFSVYSNNTGSNSNNTSNNLSSLNNNTSISSSSNINTNDFSAEKVSVTENSTPPTPSTEKKEDEVLSSFSTKVVDKSKDRKTNVDITVSKIDGYRLEPRSNFFVLRYCRKSHSGKRL